ncbi:MAG: RNA polymerase sigma factor [Pseudomonadota bacterium]
MIKFEPTTPDAALTGQLRNRQASSVDDIDEPRGKYPHDRVDRVLIEQIAKDRRSDALETLYRQYQPRMIGFLRRLTQDDNLIEDVYNEVMLQIWNKAHQYKGSSKVSSWIFSIAYRACLKMLKKQQRKQEIVQALGDWFSALGASNESAESDSNDVIGKAINTLKPNHRLVVELCYFQGYSTEEISQIAGCPVNTVKTRLYHARAKIKSFIEDAGGLDTLGEAR